MRLIVASLLTLGACVTSLAQRTDLPKHCTYEGRLFKTYDRSADRTVYNVSGGPVFKSGDVEFMIGAGLVISGEAMPTTPPDAVSFFIIVSSKTPSRASDTRLLTIVDGERKEIGAMATRGSNGNGDVHMVSYAVRLPFTDLRKFASAKKVGMRFDGVEFELSQQNQNALLDFIHLLEGSQ